MHKGRGTQFGTVSRYPRSDDNSFRVRAPNRDSRIVSDSLLNFRPIVLVSRKVQNWQNYSCFTTSCISPVILSVASSDLNPGHHQIQKLEATERARADRWDVIATADI